ncbi:MAG: hypothetical protein KBT10_00145, partial [Bacteroidales bacterium]|nr:hypothetical protein [Candidatus Sodaliphilus aphodohippi]
ISIALEHYDRAGADPDKRMRSLLYRGCVATELGNDTLAMRYYKLALQRCPASDRFHQGYIHFRIAELYAIYSENQHAVSHLKKALRIYNKLGDDSFVMEICRVLGETYTTFDSDSAYYYINKCIDMAHAAKDSSLFYIGRFDLATYEFVCRNDYRASADIMKETISKGVDYIDEYSAFYFASLALAQLGKNDSARIYFDMMPTPQSPIDSLQYLQCDGIVNANSKDYKAISEQVSRCYAIGDSITFSHMGRIMAQTELAMDVETKEHNDRYRQMWIIAAFVAIALLLTIVFVRARKLKAVARARREEIERLNEQIDKAVEQLERQREQASDDMSRQQLAFQGKIVQCIDTIIAKITRKRSGQVEMEPAFWTELEYITNETRAGLLNKIANDNISLSPSEVKVLCLHSLGMPNAVIQKLMNYESAQSVSNAKQKIVKKVLGEGHNIEEVLIYPINHD